MHVICRCCNRWQSWKSKGGPRLADCRCDHCGSALSKPNAEENAARAALNSLEVDRYLALQAAGAAPTDRVLLQEIHEMLRLALSAQVKPLAEHPVGRRVPRSFTVLRGDAMAVKGGAR